MDGTHGDVGGMSVWPVAAVAAAAGLAVGVGSAVLEARLRPWAVGDFAAVVEGRDGSAPRVDVPATSHAFGTMAAGAEGSHAFVVRNTGVTPLVLSRGSSSCACTVSDFESADGGSPADKTIAPGGETSVRVTWRGKAAGPFRQQVTILTNDPARPEIALVVEGTVIPTWKAVPETITFARLSADAGATTTARVFTYGDAPPVVDSLSVIDAATTEWFDISSTPLPADEIAGEPGATGGFVVTVAVRPGVPLGALRQTVRMALRLPEAITAELPIEGAVVGDISFAGPGWDAGRRQFVLGTVSSRLGKKTTLFLTARGPHRDSVRPAITDVVPASLEVTIGPAERIGAGGVIRIPLDISIPPGSPPANHLGSDQAPLGRITLATGIAGAATVTIPVSVVIGP